MKKTLSVLDYSLEPRISITALFVGCYMGNLLVQGRFFASVVTLILGSLASAVMAGTRSFIQEKLERARP